MKAVVYHNYGSPDVLKFEDIEKPIPGDDQVLIKIRAASVNPLDWHYMRGTPTFLRAGSGLRKPKNIRLGADVAGQVESVGKNVTQFRPGDEVFGACKGSFAEYVCSSEKKLALKPANLSFEDAAAVPVAALTALQALRDKGRIRSGQKVLVEGASGGVGTFAVQIAKSFGAEVTAVCSTGKMGTARAIGADQVLDYTREDFTKNGQHYDLILAANGYHSIIDYRRALGRNGICVLAGGGMEGIFLTMFLGPLLSMIGNKKTRLFVANVNAKDLVLLKELLEAGKIAPVIDRRYPLNEIAEAVRYLEEGHAKGKVIITVEHRG